VKRVLVSVLILVGLYVTYRGFTTITFEARGESILVLGVSIPAQDWSLYTYGTAFILVGIAMIASPLLAQKIKRRSA
jgi:hypothetical protein